MRSKKGMSSTNTVILDEEFELYGQTSLDDRKRITLTRAVDALRDLFQEEPAKLRFAIYVNKAGQILLSPETTIPLHEAWLFKNPGALHSVLRGIEQAKAGNLKDLGSFAEDAKED
jgi:hypothetical protein